MANAHPMVRALTSPCVTSSNLLSDRRSAGLTSRLLAVVVQTVVVQTVVVQTVVVQTVVVQTVVVQTIATKIRSRFENFARDLAPVFSMVPRTSSVRHPTPAVHAVIQTLVINGPIVPATRMSTLVRTVHVTRT